MTVNGSFNLAFKEMQEHFRKKELKLPTETWRDIQGSAHSKAFVIAGVTKAALLEDVFGIIEKNMESGKGYNDFRKEFRTKIIEHGWLPDDRSGRTPPLLKKEDIVEKLKTGLSRSAELKLTNLPKDYQKYLGWRTQIIYNTNMHASYMAGEWAQIQETKEYLPFLKYRHGYYGMPENPREEHQRWDGVTLPVDDVWWDAHFPPNGWNCNCGVEQLSAKEAKVTERPSGKGDVAPEWATNVGKNSAAGDKSLMRHIERIVEKGADFKIIGEKAFEYLKENSAKIYGSSLDVWVDEVFSGNYTRQNKERTVAIVDEGIITADKESVNHAIRTKKPQQQRLNKEEAKKIPAFIANAQSVYEDKQNGGLLYFKRLDDKKEVKISVKDNKFVTAVKQEYMQMQGGEAYIRGQKRRY